MNGMLNRVHNMDCMEGMARFPDGYFGLSIVDPPYFDAIKNLHYYGNRASTTGVRRNDYHLPSSWEIPKQDYFDELARVSKNQIIWGANYFDFRGMGSGRVVWDKRKNESCTFSDGEIAYCSLIGNVVFFRHRWDGFLQEDMSRKETKIHLTQKPVALYKWLLTKYGQKGDKILDTHVGSASSLVACHDLGYDFVGFEIDATTCALAAARLETARAQLRMEFA